MKGSVNSYGPDPIVEPPKENLANENKPFEGKGILPNEGIQDSNGSSIGKFFAILGIILGILILLVVLFFLFKNLKK